MNNMKRPFLHLLSALLLCCLAAPLTAAPWNGSTTAVTPTGTVYEISTAEQLAWIAQESQTNDFLGYTVRLTADIDLGGAEEVAQKWQPIGSNTAPFRGELDGQNHVISNLYMMGVFSSAGLFAETGAEAEIHHVALAQGLIMTEGTSDVGCMVGIHRGNLHHCFNMVQIIAINGDRIGGLVGTNYGTISFAHNTGIITKANDHVGGLVGLNQSTAVLNECLCTGYCVGANHAGSLFGKNEAGATLTRVFFDQQVTHMHATGYGGSETTLNNSEHTIEKTEEVNDYFTGYDGWNTEHGCFYPQLSCFAGHIASELSVACIRLDGINKHTERAEGVGTPQQDGTPRKTFNLCLDDDADWKSGNENVISVLDHSTAGVERPCGTQDVILTITKDGFSKQIYTLVKGYEAFDAGELKGGTTACWNEMGITFPQINNAGKEASGGKDDEQGDNAKAYQYMIIRYMADEHNNFTPLDTFYFAQNGYNSWEIPTDVPGRYKFERYVHDSQCRTEWAKSNGTVTLLVRKEFDPGALFATSDTIYGVPHDTIVYSKRDASGGGGVFNYTWTFEQQLVNYTTGEVTIAKRGTVYDSEGYEVKDADCPVHFDEPGEYLFTRKASETSCATVPQDAADQHRIVVFAAIIPGSITPFYQESCTPTCTDTIFEIDPVTGGNGRYIYRWTCNDEPIPNSDTTCFLVAGYPMEVGHTYTFRRQVTDDSGVADWFTSEGEFTVVVYEAYNPGALQPKDEQSCIESSIDQVPLKVSQISGASGKGEFAYCWLLYRAGADTMFLDTLAPVTPTLDTTILLSTYHLSVPVTLMVQRKVQNSRCLSEWRTSENSAVWKLGRAEKQTQTLTVCATEMPYRHTYTFHDGKTQTCTFAENGASVVLHDQTIEGCPLEMTLVCRVVAVPEVELQPTVSVCQTDSVLVLRYTINEGSPDRYDITFLEEALELGFQNIEGGLLTSTEILIPVPEDVPLGRYGLQIVFYSSVSGTASCKGVTQSVSFSLDVDGYVHRKWNDVVFVDNSDKNCEPNCESDLVFVSYQWYRDGVAIEGATEQSYYEYEGLNGVYSVDMIATDGTVYRSCEYDMRPNDAIEPTYVDGEPVDGLFYTIDGRQCAQPNAAGVYIFCGWDANNNRITRKIILR